MDLTSPKRKRVDPLPSPHLLNRGLVQARVTLGGVKLRPILPRNPCSRTSCVQRNVVVCQEKCYPGPVYFEPGPKMRTASGPTAPRVFAGDNSPSLWGR